MSHIVAKRSTKESAEKEAKKAKKSIRGKITVKKYGSKWGVFIE